MTAKKFLAILLLALWPSHLWATATTFDGGGDADDKIDVTSFAGIEGTAFTVGCWTYRTGDGEAQRGRILDKFQAANGWVLNYNNIDVTDKYLFLVDFDTTNGTWNIDASAANEWHHLAVSYDGSSTANDPTFYLNAVEQTETEAATPDGSYVTGTNILSIGNRSTAANTWTGHLASCFYYNRILTAAEIKQVMHRGPQTLKNGLVCYWPLGVFTVYGHGGGSGGSSCAGTASGSPVTTGIGPPVSIPQGGGM
jgi:hypothetical protein